MATDLNALYKAFSQINQTIYNRGQYNVSPDPEFDYLAQMDAVMNRANRLQQASVSQALTNASIRLHNQAALPPNIRFPNVTMSNSAGGRKPTLGLNIQGGKLPGFTPEQMRVAQLIAQTGRRLGASRKDIVTGLTTGIVESGLRNVNYGDRDSLGVFQQRAPWGSRKARTNVRKSARLFFKGGRGGEQGLFGVAGRSHRPIGVNAQDVQVSAYPGRYHQHVDEARRIMEFLTRYRGPKRGQSQSTSG